jgi:hypothetical protein
LKEKFDLVNILRKEGALSQGDSETIQIDNSTSNFIPPGLPEEHIPLPAASANSGFHPTNESLEPKYYG